MNPGSDLPLDRRTRGNYSWSDGRSRARGGDFRPINRERMPFQNKENNDFFFNMFEFHKNHVEKNKQFFSFKINLCM